MPSIRRKIALQVVVSNLSIVVNFALAVILARLLSPDDIGVFSMSAVLIAIAHTFRDFGVTSYLKREKTLTDQTIRTARGLLYITSWSMALAMFLSAGFWARFFNEVRVEEVVRVLALGFVFIPLGAIAQAVMIRELNVIRSSKVVVVSTLVYFIVSVSLALLGFQHMTMAWANLVNILVTGLAYNWYLGRRLPWMPSLQGWRSMVSFGTANVLTALCKVINTSIPTLVLGSLSVAADVGLFSRAVSTVQMVGKVIGPSITYFTLPYMARIHHTTGNVSADYLHAGSIINSVMLPVFVWVAIMAHDIVLLLFGEQWLSAVPAIPWLCAAAAIATLFRLSSSTVVSVGRPFAALPPLVILIVAKFLAIFVIYNGTLESFAIAIFTGELFSIPYYIYINSSLLKVKFRLWTLDLARQLIVVFILASSLELLISIAPDSLPAFLNLILTGLLTLILGIISFALVKLPIMIELTKIRNFIENKFKQTN